MKQNIYSIFDSAAGAYMRPFFAISDALALRSFGDICCDADHPVGQHPKDYTLFRVGIFDDNNGQLIPETPEALRNGLTMVKDSQKIASNSLKQFDASISPGGTA